MYSPSQTFNQGNSQDMKPKKNTKLFFFKFRVGFQEKTSVMFIFIIFSQKGTRPSTCILQATKIEIILGKHKLDSPLFF